MKKIIIIFLFLFTFTFIFSSSNDILNIPLDTAETIALMDLPLIKGIYSFASMTEFFMVLAASIAFYACFFLLIFTSFKLWAGTTEGKKAFVDVLSKVVIFIIVLTLYNPIAYNILFLSVTIGMEASGVAPDLANSYVATYGTLLNQVKEGMNIVKDEVFQQIAESGKTEIDPNQLNLLLETGWTPEQIQQMAKEHGYTMLYKNDGYQYSWGQVLAYGAVGAVGGGAAGTIIPGLGNALGALAGGGIGLAVGATVLGATALKNNIFGYKDENGKSVVRFGISMSKHKKNLEKNLKEKNYSPEKQKRALEKIIALTEVLTGDVLTVDPENGDFDTQMIQVKNKAIAILSDPTWDPFILGKNDIPSLILSPSKIIKSIAIMSSSIAETLEITVKKDGLLDKIRILPEPSSIFRFILYLVYKVAMIIGAIIIMVEYSITILEFFLVKSVAVILLPLLFIDATKAYAINLLNLALAYFFKIMIIIMLCFWSLGFYLETLQIIFIDHDASNIMTLVFLLSTLILGLFFTLNGPKIASTVISGSPSMGAGDIARGISNTIRTANHARQLGGAVAKGVAGFAQKSVRQGMGTVARFQGAKDKSQNVQAGLREARDKGKYTGSDKDIASAGRQAMVSSLMGGMIQDMGDKAYKALTGNERPHLDDEGYKEDSHLKVGQKFYDPKLKMEKIATMEDVKKHAKGGKESIQKMTQKAMNKHKRSSGKELKQKLNGRRPASYEEKFPNG